MTFGKPVTLAELGKMIRSKGPAGLDLGETERSLSAGRPLPGRYAKLIRELTRASGRLDAGHDSLDAAVEQLAAVITFLHEDSAVSLRGGITRPLTLLVAAIYDVSKGGRPPLIFARDRVANRPGATAFDTARGQLAAVLDELVCAGMRVGKAADWLAKECRGITWPGGRAINAATLQQWRTVVRHGKAPADVAKMFDWVKEYERKRASASGHQTVEDAQRRCKILLCSLQRIFPINPPT
jgi:hypothetical protein